MFGVFSCSGARLLRNVTPAPAVSSALESHFGTRNLSGEVGLLTGKGSNVNWSQKRFLRGQSPFSDSENSTTCIEPMPNLIKSDSENVTVNSNQNVHSMRKYRRSLRGYQSTFITHIQQSNDKELEQLVAEVTKIIVENGTETIRIKTRKEEDLVKEWIGIQNELRTIQNDRVEEDRKKLEIAGEQVLREMARLTKSINLDDLDQAIEGALCSQVKTDYGHQQSSHDQ